MKASPRHTSSGTTRTLRRPTLHPTEDHFPPSLDPKSRTHRPPSTPVPATSAHRPRRPPLQQIGWPGSRPQHAIHRWQHDPHPIRGSQSASSVPLDKRQAAMHLTLDLNFDCQNRPRLTSPARACLAPRLAPSHPAARPPGPPFPPGPPRRRHRRHRGCSTRGLHGLKIICPVQRLALVSAYDLQGLAASGDGGQLSCRPRQMMKPFSFGPNRRATPVLLQPMSNVLGSPAPRTAR